MEMRKLSKAFLCAALILTGCATAYDDSSLRQDITDIQKRLTEVEKRVSDLNADLTRLQELVSAVQNGKEILSVAEETRDGEKVWVLLFSDNTEIVLRSGKDGKDGTDGKDGKDGKDGHSPVIGVKQFTDGLWYWTLDGEWLLDGNGNKIPASATDGKDGEDGTDGVTPQLKIDGAYWWISYDGGSTWNKLTDYSNPVPECPVTDIDSTSSSLFVTVYLKNGEAIKIPRYRPLSIEFGKEEIAIMTPGASAKIAYTITGGTDANVVKALGQGGWIASAEPVDAHSGVIKVTAPDPIVSCEIIVLVNDGEGYTALSSINCVKGEIRIADTEMRISDKGGTLEIPLQTNLDSYSVDTDADWIQYSETKAMRSETVCLTVLPNTVEEERYASVLFKEGESTVFTVIVFQDPKGLPQEYGVWAADGNAVYAYDPSKAQMSKYEAAGEAWFRFVEPAGVVINEIGPIPAQPMLQDTFTASFSRSEAGETLSSDNLSLMVRSIDGEKLILSTEDKTTYFVIRF